MAIGDMVNGVNPTGGAVWFTVQPAGTNELIVLSVFGYGAAKVMLTQGVQEANLIFSDGAEYNAGMNCRLGINNTNYLQIYNAESTLPHSSGYSAIQIK